MKIQLVNTPSDHEDALNQKWYTPLGLISIGTYLETSGYEVEILDGQHFSLNEIKRRLDSKIVGANFNIFSTEALDSIVATAKDNGALVIVGGQAATPLAKQLLMKNKNVDVVVRYDGEEALKQIAERARTGSTDFRGIPNVAYRQDEEIIEERIELLNLQTALIPNRRINGINLEQYIRSWSKDWDPEKRFRPTSIYTKKGCPRKCSFCARIDKEVRQRTPEMAFLEYKQLVTEFGVNYLYEVNDTHFYDTAWLKKFRRVYEKEGGLDTKIWAFADIRDINSETVDYMKSIGVYTVLIGIESGNEEIRKRNGKPFTNKQVLKACALLGKYDINVSDAWVLGLPGETQETISQTYSLSIQIRNYCKTIDTGFCKIMPLPGSKIWEMMMQLPELEVKYGNEYKFNINELREDYLTHFCRL